jgi:hypothetical protein
MVRLFARAKTFVIRSERRPWFEVIAAANKLQPETGSADRTLKFMRNTDWKQWHLCLGYRQACQGHRSLKSIRGCKWNCCADHISETNQEHQETSIRGYRPTVPPSWCLATHPRTDCNPKSTSRFAHTLQGYAGRCPMQSSSIGHRGAQHYSTNELLSIIKHKRVALTEYLFTSSVWLSTALIFDIASMAMMPLIARLVWLLTFRLSAEILRNRPLVSHVYSVDSKKNIYWLVVNSVEPFK